MDSYVLAASMRELDFTCETVRPDLARFCRRAAGAAKS